MERATKRFSSTKSETTEEIEQDAAPQKEADIITIACEITNYNIVEFNKIFWSVSFGDALIIYREKKEKEQREYRESAKLKLFIADVLARVWGADTKLLENYDGNKNEEKNEIDVMEIHRQAGGKIINYEERK